MAAERFKMIVLWDYVANIEYTPKHCLKIASGVTERLCLGNSLRKSIQEWE